MSQTKFTPGDWAARRYTPEFGLTTHWIENQFGERIATIENSEDVDLMTASKAMYEALELADKALESLAQLEGFTTPCHENIKQSLSKARGEQTTQQ